MKVTLLDPAKYPTEATAMLQALYSRSSTPISEHINSKAPEELEKKMKQFYVGYGHKSIGDCASTTLFLEGVSILAAKVIQDNFAYNGQECSTRYIDFKETGLYIPDDLPEDIKVIGNELIEKYEFIYKETLANLKETKSCPEDTDEGTWHKTLSARAFDIARGWLPAGALTNLSWHTNLRQLSDRLELLTVHPLEEIRTLAAEMKRQALEAYPSSFKEKVYEETNEFYKAYGMEYSYSMLSLQELSGELNFAEIAEENAVVFMDNVLSVPNELMAVAKERPKNALLPRSFAGLGNYEVMFPLDFASYRDIQRQRSAYIPNVVLLPHAGMHNWYLGNLPESISREIRVYTDGLRVKLSEEDNATPLDLQYVTPIGFKVPVYMQADIRAMTYILELRSSRHVHQSLRDVISVIAQRVFSTNPGYALYLDEHNDDLDPRRGAQDITQVSANEWDELVKSLEGEEEREPDIIIDVNLDLTKS